jgi:alpha-galactosidase
MTKLAFIGAGSFGFTRGLVRDVLTFPLLKDAEICLMDIDDERLDFAYKSVTKIVELGNYPARVTATKDRVEALKGADVVLVTILVGATDVWRYDIEIPKKYGVDFNVGDTRGTAGIFRALRTIPVMVDIAKDMEKYCPNALMLNYTNPMAMLCRAMKRASSIQLTGLCHSVQGTAEMLAEWIGAPMSEINYTCAGINHQAWYLKYEWNGKDAYPLIRAAVEKEGNRPQRDVQGFRLLRHRILRAQFGIQLVVPQTPGSDREILHARHRLESRRVRLYSR